MQGSLVVICRDFLGYGVRRWDKLQRGVGGDERGCRYLAGKNVDLSKWGTGKYLLLILVGPPSVYVVSPLESVQAGDGGGTIVCRCVDGRCRGVCSCIGDC